MISKRMTRAEMIRWLGDAISTETEKPFEEIDYDFVDECGCLLDKLSGKSDAVSENEIVDRIEKLKLANTSDKRRKVGRRKLWKILLAAAIVMCMTITVVAVPELRIKLLNALQLNVGESVEEDGITYIHGGETRYYSNIDTLISAESLDILSFENLQSELKVTSVKYIDDASMTIVTFNDPSISFQISHNQKYIIDDTTNFSQKYSASDIDAHILSKEINNTIIYNAYVYYGNDTYIISCPSESILHTILNALKKGK